MKRISLLLMTCALGITPVARGQDAATEERLNKLSGRIDDVMAAQESMRKQISDLAKEIESVREQAAKPTGNYASQDDLNRLKKAVEEVDRKRVNDAEETQKQLLKVRDAVLKMPAPPSGGTRPKSASRDKETMPTADKTDRADKGNKSDKAPTGDETGIPYIIQSGDTLSVIAQACREKNIKVTVDQILKANPGLNEKKLKPGQKIFIPAAPPAT